MENLECVFCQKKYPLDLFYPFCPECRQPLLFSYPSKRRKFFPAKQGLEKYLDFLPLREINQNLSLGEGNTPLLNLNRIQKKLNLSFVLAKNETTNPTHSFKDRGSAAKKILRLINFSPRLFLIPQWSKFKEITASFFVRATPLVRSSKYTS